MLIVFLVIIAMLSPLVFALPAKAKYTYSLVLLAVCALAASYFSVGVLVSGTPLTFSGGMNMLFGELVFSVDRLSALFVIIISVAALSVGVYSKGYLDKCAEGKTPQHLSLHFMSIILMYVSMLLVVAARDAFSFLFSWEMMTISSFVLILFDAEKREVRKAALNYLILMHVGFVFILAGFVMVSASGLPASFDSLKEYFSLNNYLPLFLVFLVGFGMKAGMFPLHIWMPEVYPAAAYNVSAFMSSVVVKMGVYGVIRVVSCIGEGLSTVGTILFVAGVVTGLYGAVMATVQNEMRRLLAYSSVENIGIIFMAMGMSAIGLGSGNTFLALCGMSGALLHTMNHSFFKTLLFFGTGNVHTATGTTSLDSLGGVSRQMPVTSALFLVGVVAIAALPPLNGFVSEFLIYYGLFDTIGQGAGSVVMAMCGIAALALIGSMVLLAFTKLYGITFLGSPRSHAVEHAEEVSMSRLVACTIPVAGIILVGLAPFLFTDMMFVVSGELLGIDNIQLHNKGIDTQVWKMASVAIMFLMTVALLLVYRRMRLRGRVVEKSPVWGCGFTSPSHKMQYSGESFSEGLYGISSSMAKVRSEGDVFSKNEVFPKKRSFKFRHKDKITVLFARMWFEFIKVVNRRVRRLNTGKINHYVMYALIFLVLILVLSLISVI